MRIDHHRARPMRHDRARELRHGHHRALDVEVAVDQSRREIGTIQIDDFARFVVADADDAAIINRHVSRINLAAEDVHELRVFEEQLGRRFAARDAQFMFEVSHLVRAVSNPSSRVERSAAEEPRCGSAR